MRPLSAERTDAARTGACRKQGCRKRNTRAGSAAAQPRRGGWKIEGVLRTGFGVVMSSVNCPAPSADRPSPALARMTSFAPPAVGAGADGGAWRSGAPEQSGPRHGPGCEGNLSGAGATCSAAAWGPFRTTTWLPHPAVARPGVAHDTSASSRAARQSRNGEGRESTIVATTSTLSVAGARINRKVGPARRADPPSEGLRHVLGGSPHRDRFVRRGRPLNNPAFRSRSRWVLSVTPRSRARRWPEVAPVAHAPARRAMSPLVTRPTRKFATGEIASRRSRTGGRAALLGRSVGGQTGVAELVPESGAVQSEPLGALPEVAAGRPQHAVEQHPLHRRDHLRMEIRRPTVE